MSCRLHSTTVSHGERQDVSFDWIDLQHTIASLLEHHSYLSHERKSNLFHLIANYFSYWIIQYSQISKWHFVELF